jgi:hypothetical protein
MFLVVHASVGALVGNAVGNPAAAFSVNFLLHFLLDMIPHGDQMLYEDYKQGKKVRKAMIHTGMDALAAAIVVAIIFSFGDFISEASVAAGVVGGLLPDFLVGMYELFHPKGRRWTGRQLDRFNRLHMHNHVFLIRNLFRTDMPLKIGFVMQAVAIVAILKLML